MFDPALATLGALAVVQGATTAFWAGSVTQRLHALERAVQPVAGLAEKLSRLDGLIETLLARLPDPELAVRPRRRVRDVDL